MFRGSPDHNYVTDSKTSTPFNQVAWKFDASAPIRSTVAASADAIFFGSSRGMFYSLNKLSGKVNWSVDAGYPIHSSAALNRGHVFFSDNKQTLWSLNAKTGRLNWKTSLGQSINYAWAFDYYYSSPAIANGQVFIGSKDGCVYDIDETTGKVKWKFKTGGIVRSSPAVTGNVLYVGDTEGTLYALNVVTGKQLWRFQIVGHGLKNEKFGYDRSDHRLAGGIWKQGNRRRAGRVFVCRRQKFGQTGLAGRPSNFMGSLLRCRKSTELWSWVHPTAILYRLSISTRANRSGNSPPLLSCGRRPALMATGFT